MVVRKDSFTVHFFDAEPDKTFPTLEEAKKAASEHVGNSRYAKPFPKEDTYLYGPGDGTTSVMVRRDFDITSEES